MKHCKRCGRDLPLARFFKNKASKDGLAFYCSDCSKAAVVESMKKSDPIDAPVEVRAEASAPEKNNDMFQYCEYCGLPVYIDMRLHIWRTHQG